MKPAGRSYRVIVQCRITRRVYHYYVMAISKEEAKSKTMIQFRSMFETGTAKITDCSFWEFFS